MSPEVQAKVEQFFAPYTLRKYPKDQIIIFGGDTPESVYYLVSGKVKQYDISYRGDEIILNVFKHPSFFPMSLAINHADNPYFYQAETDVELRQAPAKEMVDFLKSNADVSFDLLSRLYRGIDGILGRMSALMSGSARSRLLYELILESRRFGTMHSDGSCTLEISEKDLGARAGLSRETVNREIHKLKNDGLIKVGRNDMTIPDLTKFTTTLSEEI